jgi:hypothetical protein
MPTLSNRDLRCLPPLLILHLKLTYQLNKFWFRCLILKVDLLALIVAKHEILDKDIYNFDKIGRQLSTIHPQKLN